MRHCQQGMPNLRFSTSLPENLAFAHMIGRLELRFAGESVLAPFQAGTFLGRHIGESCSEAIFLRSFRAISELLERLRMITAESRFK